MLRGVEPGDAETAVDFAAALKRVDDEDYWLLEGVVLRDHAEVRHAQARLAPLGAFQWLGRDRKPSLWGAFAFMAFAFAYMVLSLLPAVGTLYVFGSLLIGYPIDVRLLGSGFGVVALMTIVYMATVARAPGGDDNERMIGWGLLGTATFCLMGSAATALSSWQALAPFAVGFPLAIAVGSVMVHLSRRELTPFNHERREQIMRLCDAVAAIPPRQLALLLGERAEALELVAERGLKSHSEIQRALDTPLGLLGQAMRPRPELPVRTGRKSRRNRTAVPRNRMESGRTATQFAALIDSWQPGDWWWLEARALHLAPELRSAQAALARGLTAEQLWDNQLKADRRGRVTEILSGAAPAFPLMALGLLAGSWGTDLPAPLGLAGTLAGIGAALGLAELVTARQRTHTMDEHGAQIRGLLHLVPSLASALTGAMALLSHIPAREPLGMVGLVADLAVGVATVVHFRPGRDWRAGAVHKNAVELQLTVQALPSDVAAAIRADLQRALQTLVRRRFVAESVAARAAAASVGFLALTMEPSGGATNTPPQADLR